MRTTIWTERLGNHWLAAMMALGAALPLNPTKAASADSATVSTTVSPNGGRIIVEATGVESTMPVIFTAAIDQRVRLSAKEAAGEATVVLRIIQGRPEVLTLGLSGDGDVVDVSGAGVKEWAVRQAGVEKPGRRFLDVRVATEGARKAPATVELLVRTRLTDLAVPGRVTPVIIVGGDAVGAEWRGRFEPGADVDLHLDRARGVIATDTAGPADRTLAFVGAGDPVIQFGLARRGGISAEMELTQARLAGRVNEAEKSIAFHLHAEARVERAGLRLHMLSGAAAWVGATSGDGWHAEGNVDGKEPGYDVWFDRAGVVTIETDFVSPIREAGDWRRVNFQIAGAVVMPLTLTGLASALEFDRAVSIVPERTGADWQGFVPADGRAGLGWRAGADKSEGALFFSSSEVSDLQIGAGLARQTSVISFRILQGRLGTVRLRVEGPGEVVGVDGENVLGWQVRAIDGARLIEVRLSRPYESEGKLTIQSQNVLGGFPTSTTPLRLSPDGAVRHSGYLRVTNVGAVRLEVGDAEGLMQLVPEQFPGSPADPQARQVLVYRFPAAARSFRVLATRILPEVAVAEVVTYQLGETDRVIDADLELDIREAPLRDWQLSIPSTYGVVAVQGAAVADYNAESGSANGTRALKVFFTDAVSGRQLLHLRLERSQAAAAGEWVLPPLRYPDAKTVRGHVGVIATPGYRVIPAFVDQLSEVPLTLFPKQTTGLQQAFRIREASWTAKLKIEPLGQTVQADVFHLYTLQEGAIHASVLLNYFVVGAPSTEWRLEVPATAGNIDVTGQGVRREWRREGNVVIVTLHQPVLGSSTMLVTFDQPMSARGGMLRPGEVRPLGVQAERGYVQLVSAHQVKTEVQQAEGNLLKLETLELPAELRLLTTVPSVAVYQYVARPFALQIGVAWYQAGEAIDQVVDFAQFSSQVTRDGQVVTDARLFVKTRGQKVLRFQLPAGVKLWETRVDGELSTARADGPWTLVPLSARLNPNEPVAVNLRLGRGNGGATRRVLLEAPRFGIPLVMGEWTVRSDPERLLVPKGGSAQVVRPNLVESGFEWLAGRELPATITLLLLVAVAVFAFRVRTGSGAGWAVASGVFGVVVAIWLLTDAVRYGRENSLELTYAASVLPANGEISLEVANLPAWQALISGWGVAALIGGIALGYGAARENPARIVRRRTWVGGAVAFGAAGLLAQRGGAMLFFGTIAVALVITVVIPGLRSLANLWRARRGGDAPGRATTATVSLILGGILAGAVAGSTPRMTAAEVSPPSPAGGSLLSFVQRWEVRDHRLYAEADLAVQGGPGDSFLLLQAPAVLTDFRGEGLKVVKIAGPDGERYAVVPERIGRFVARAKYEVAVSELGRGLPILTGTATVQRIALRIDEGGWEFHSARAVEVRPIAGLGANRSGAELVLGTAGTPLITLVPLRRNVNAELTQFFAEVGTLFVPGPGAVNAYARIAIRPVQGKVNAVDVRVPEGLTVGDVSRGPVGAWRYDPTKRLLHVTMEPAKSEAFSFVVELQQSAGELPFDVTLRPLRVEGAAGEVGTLGVAAGSDAQPEAIHPNGMSAVTIDDFDHDLIPRGRDRQPLATLQAAFRYTAEEPSVTLRVAPVVPEIRVASRQLLSLGDDRLVLAADLAVSIQRVGIFQLNVVLPSGMELEAASGAALSHYTQSTEGGRQVVTLHLAGRTIGEQSFALTLAGPAPAGAPSWVVPRLTVREAARQTGELQLVPERGLRLRTIERRNVTELDPRGLGNTRSGALAFRLLEQDWALTLGIEALEPWVTVQALEEVTAREGQTLTRLALRYRIENAALKQLRVALPGITPEQARMARATGPAVSDFVPVPDQPGQWDIRFQRGVMGETAVQIEYQGAATRDQGSETLAPPVFVGVRQVTQFVAVRGGGRLEVEAAELPRGWQRIDWASVPANLQNRSDRTVPPLAFRVVEAERPLTVAVRRHDLADSVKLRVTGGELTTLFAPTGAMLTSVALRFDVAEKSTLRVRLPERAELFNTIVNGESSPVVREGDAYLFHVAANTTGDRSANVRLVYSVPTVRHGEVVLEGPRLNVPIQDVTWQVVVPPGYMVEDYHGGLRLRSRQRTGAFGDTDYESTLVLKRAADARQATIDLETANSLLQHGKQQQAGEVLLRAANAATLDEASNEDARVQLRALRTQQAIIGLNTRRQRMYLDANAEGVRNETLEQAANLNPLMRGKLEFDLQQTDQLLMGNTVEENTALRGIAGRIVEQQLAAEPSVGAIDVTLPLSGSVMTFTRSLEVNADAPLELRLSLARVEVGRSIVGLGLLAGLGVIAALGLRMR